MSDIYVFSPNEEENDYSTMGLVGALTPTKCTFTEMANGESSIELSHPLDEFGRYTHLVRGNILVVPVPVRTTPEIENGQCVTQVWRYKVKRKALLTSTAQRTLYKKEKGTGRKKIMKPGDKVTVVLRREKEGTRWKVKSKYGTGWINPDGFEEDKEEVIPDNSAAIETVQSPWSVTDQLFRIFEVKKNMDSIDVSARHISYDLLYNMTYYRNKESATLQEALDGILSETYAPHDFTAYTDVANKYAGLFYDNKNIIEVMLDPEEGLCKRYDVDLVRDNYELYLLHDPGINRGVRIQYGKNMTGVEFTESDEEVVTRVVPIGEKKNGQKLYLTDDEEDFEGRYIDSERYKEHPEEYPVIHVAQLECENCKVSEEEDGNGDDKADGKVTKKIARQRMRDQVAKLFEEEIDLPKVEMHVEFVNLGDTEEYKQFQGLENCFLYDYVIVQHPRLNIDITARIVQFEWDCLLDRMNSVEIGSLQETLANTGITSWQIPSGLSGSKIAGGTIGSGQLGDDIISARHVQADSISSRAIQADAITTRELKAGVVEAEVLKAVDAVIDHLKVQDLDTDELTAKLAEIQKLIAEYAKFSWAAVENLVASVFQVQKGEGEEVYIKNLAVTYAQIACAAIGELVIKGSDGKYYRLDVNEEGQLVPVDVTEYIGDSDIAAGRTSEGLAILETDLTLDDLHASDVYAIYMLVNRLEAMSIDADTLFAREAFINTLRSAKIIGENTLEFLARCTLRSITDADLEYYLSTSPSVPVGGEWLTECPTPIPQDMYLWHRTKTTTVSGETKYSGMECLTASFGVVGPAGVGIHHIDEHYAVWNSDSEPPTEWSDKPPVTTPEMRYLWNYETFVYTDLTSVDTNKRVIGYYSEDGRGILSITNYYLATSQDSGVTRDTPGWTASAQTPSATKKYLWNYEAIAFTDGSPVEYTTPCIIGAHGDTGPQGLQGLQGPAGEQGIPGVPGPAGESTYFHIKYSPIANPKSSADMTETPSAYIGTYVDNNPADSTNPSSYTWSRFQGLKGEDGLAGVNGADGKTSYLHIKYSNDCGLTFTAENGEAVGKYIGQYVDFTQADSNRPSDYKWSLIKGRGITKVDEQYYLSDSSTTQTGGEWLSEMPEWEDGKYIWVRTVVTYDDGTTGYSMRLAGALNSANEMAGSSQYVETYFRVLAAREVDADDPTEYWEPGIYIGQRTEEGDSSPVQAFINANGAFEVLDGHTITASISSDRFMLGPLYFSRSGTGSVCINWSDASRLAMTWDQEVDKYGGKFGSSKI